MKTSLSFARALPLLALAASGLLAACTVEGGPADGTNPGPTEPAEEQPADDTGNPNDTKGDGRDGPGEVAYGCVALATQELALDEVSPLGFSGADVLAVSAGEHAGTFTWAKGGSTPVTLSVAHAGTEARFVDYGWKDDGNADGPVQADAPECPDTLVVDASVELATEDGAFAEALEAELFAHTKDGVQAVIGLDPAEVQGTYEVTEVDPSQYDAVRLFLELRFDAERLYGTLSGQAEESGNPEDPESPVSATFFEVGSF